MKRVLYTNYFNQLYAQIEIVRVDASATEEEALACCKDTIIVLRQDHLCLFIGDQIKIIRDSDHDMYSFEFVTKKTPYPIDPRSLNREKIEALFENPDYMLTSDDFEKVSWSISEAYQKLRETYPNKKEFLLSSSDYRIEELVGA